MNVVGKVLGGGGIDFSKSSFEVLVLLFLVLLIKSTLIYYTYNTIAPKLISNIQDKPVQSFRPLSFSESIMFMILANNLFT